MRVGRWAAILGLATALGAAAQEPDLAKPVPLEKLNTDADEVDPFAPDGLTLLYASSKSGRFEILQAKRSAVTQPWPAGKPLVNLFAADVRGPSFFKGFVYFASNHAGGEEAKKAKNFDLYRRLDQSAPFPLLAIAQPEDEARPWILPSGAEFYFSRKTKAGWVQMVALGPAPGPVGKEREVGFAPGFSHATLSAAGLTMYLQGPVEGERLGIYRSTRPRIGGAWTKPEPVAKLNHPDAKRGDQTPCLTPDGSRLYFASDRPGGKGGLDLWTVPTANLK